MKFFAIVSFWYSSDETNFKMHGYCITQYVNSLWISRYGYFNKSCLDTMNLFIAPLQYLWIGCLREIIREILKTERKFEGDQRKCILWSHQCLILETRGNFSGIKKTSNVFCQYQMSRWIYSGAQSSRRQEMTKELRLCHFEKCHTWE